MKMIEIFTYLSELFAGHPAASFQNTNDIPEKDKELSEEELNANEMADGVFLSQDLVCRRGGYDRHFLA